MIVNDYQEKETWGNVIHIYIPKYVFCKCWIIAKSNFLYFYVEVIWIYLHKVFIHITESKYVLVDIIDYQLYHIITETSRFSQFDKRSIKLSLITPKFLIKIYIYINYKFTCLFFFLFVTISLNNSLISYLHFVSNNLYIVFFYL